MNLDCPLEAFERPEVAALKALIAVVERNVTVVEHGLKGRVERLSDIYYGKGSPRRVTVDEITDDSGRSILLDARIALLNARVALVNATN